ncbi:MAG: hypothetical protein WCE23_03300 [Candidatus Binatus sp.]|uniref:DUF7665 family protein n=1 Tax=Candidatus Binatus sp. TaxID=2811406 RepID=UPI003C761088
MPDDPVQKAITFDLSSARFLAGVARRQWRKVSYDFPVLVMAVAAIEPNGKSTEYFFRFELSGFPGTAPEIKIWDSKTSGLLAVDKRPKGSERVVKAFQDWGDHTVYRPWERFSGGHNNFARDFPDLAWHPKRDLTFILEDLHGLLTSNAAARR